MTSFTAKSLVHLTRLLAKNCEMLEEIVMTSEGESEEVITFESLKYLELTCLSSFKSFCSGKHTFIFSSLATLKVMGCHKMQSFSSGVATVPFLKMVEVENGKKHWKEDLNTTIEHLFKDKEIGGLHVDRKESSSKNIERSQTHQMSASTSRALRAKELGAQSKADEIVDSEKPEIHKLRLQIQVLIHKIRAKCPWNRPVKTYQVLQKMQLLGLKR
ncbi:uncharacterized protein LOC129321651 [Prosopis cineraria]|uniref:uncharacterized protein LOC129321651 n=1 Tax=Prosopis cineraria TaxID=364024 RepID=UPI0024107B42|nr:uncharacterized protein LOC129321651 [Prosopis cineraria]